MYIKTKSAALPLPALLCLCFLLVPRARAQSSTPPPASDSSTTAVVPVKTSGANTATDAEDQDVTTLEKFTVSDVPLSEQILPTVRPIDSVYGDDRSIIDIPRSVSSVNAAWLEDRQVKNAMEFGQFAPGVYAAADYGIPGVPQIRGDYAQIAVDGQMIPYSRNSVPLSFNGVEAMDIVKGPGTATMGPQGNGLGGFVNFVAKQPYFDAQHIDFSATLGTWTSGHSYGNPQYTLDFGGPLTDKLAYRVSYLARYGDEYYVNAKDQTQDVYVALTYRATKNLKFEYWAQGFATRTNEDTGANRVTQQFIWNGTYIAGAATPATSGPLPFYGYDVFLPGDGSPSNPNNYPSGSDGAFQVVNPATAHNVKLPAYDSLVGPNDTARSKLFQSQLKTTLALTPDSAVVNYAFYSLEHSNKFETYGYDEWVPRNFNLQDKLEYDNKFNLGSVENNIIAGLDLRYQYVRSGDDFSSEPFAYYDLSQSLDNVFYPGYAIENNTWGSGLGVAGHPGYSYEEMQDTTIGDYAAFIQDDVRFTKRLSAILGFREDAISANTANPPLVEEGVNIADNSQSLYTVPGNYLGYFSLPTPIYLDRGALYHYSASTVNPGYFISPVFKLTDTQSIYFTFDKVDAITGQTNFGGVDDGYEGVDRLKSDLSTASKLYEIGYKGSYLNNTLYGGISVYQQYKVEPQPRGAPPNQIRSEGIELDLVYQPTKRLSVNANATYQDVTAYGSFFEETGNYLDAYATTTPVDGTFGTGVGAVNYGANNINPATGLPGYAYFPPSGKIRAAGVPSVMANVFVDYKLTRTIGIGMGPSIIGRQNQDDEGLLHIPGEYELDGYITYTPSRRWDIRLNGTNLTNQRILDPIDTSFAGNDVIFVRAPISGSVTIRLHY
ncbi:MAG TPA: TonB-dependent receptor [Opitutaceae bacterium]